MRLCILEADRPAEAFQPEHGTYAGMFMRWLGPHLPEAEFTNVFVADGEALPYPTDFDAYLITGSRAGAYEDHAWIAPFEEFLRAVRSARIPLVGVCFGHQIMAQAFDGMVRKSDGGWIIGRQEHKLTTEGAALFGPSALSALSFHQDQVVELPPGARHLLSNTASPNGGLVYDDFPAMSLQFHPEFQPAYIRDLLVAASGIRVPAPLAETALASLSDPLEPDRIAQGVARFYRTHAKVNA